MSSKSIEEIMKQNEIHDSKIPHAELDLPSWNPGGKKDATPQTFEERKGDVSKS